MASGVGSNKNQASDRGGETAPDGWREASQKRPENAGAEDHRDADARDEQADVRDVIADQRDEAVSLAAFLSHHDGYDAAVKARRSAAVDRMDAKIDRTSSAQDRAKLSGRDRG